MTPKQLRDQIAGLITTANTSADNVYSGRYLGHILNNLDYSNRKIVDVNIVERSYENFHPRTTRAIATYSVTIDVIVFVTENVMDEVDNLIEEVKDAILSDCSFVEEKVGLTSWTETIIINMDMEKEFVIGQIVFEVQESYTNP